MAKKNNKNGGNTPHIKGDELVQDINQQLVNLFTDIANLNDDDIKLIEKYKRGEEKKFLCLNSNTKILELCKANVSDEFE